MTIKYLTESLAHESELKSDGFYTNNKLKADIQFECSNCGTISTGFTNKVCDENIWGLCPNCKEHCIIYNVDNNYQQ